MNTRRAGGFLRRVQKGRKMVSSREIPMKFPGRYFMSNCMHRPKLEMGTWARHQR